MMIKQRGFTIIELIVVIAIIAVLAGIVLVNVQQYILKSRDSAAKADMAQMISAGASFFDKNGFYEDTNNPLNNVCWYFNTLNFWTNLIKLQPSGPQFVPDCTRTSTAWCFCMPLNETNQYYCVDSTGNKKQTTVNPPLSSTCNTLCGGSSSTACQ